MTPAPCGRTRPPIAARHWSFFPAPLPRGSRRSCCRKSGNSGRGRSGRRARDRWWGGHGPSEPDPCLRPSAISGFNTQTPAVLGSQPRNPQARSPRPPSPRPPATPAAPPPAKLPSRYEVVVAPRRCAYSPRAVFARVHSARLLRAGRATAPTSTRTPIRAPNASCFWHDPGPFGNGAEPASRFRRTSTRVRKHIPLGIEAAGSGRPRAKPTRIGPLLRIPACRPAREVSGTAAVGPAICGPTSATAAALSFSNHYTIVREHIGATAPVFSLEASRRNRTPTQLPAGERSPACYRVLRSPPCPPLRSWSRCLPSRAGWVGVRRVPARASRAAERPLGDRCCRLSRPAPCCIRVPAKSTPLSQLETLACNPLGSAPKALSHMASARRSEEMECESERRLAGCRAARGSRLLGPLRAASPSRSTNSPRPCAEQVRARGWRAGPARPLVPPGRPSCASRNVVLFQFVRRDMGVSHGHRGAGSSKASCAARPGEDNPACVRAACCPTGSHLIRDLPR